MNREIGTILAGLREGAKLTQKSLADAMTANQSRISRLESGEGNLDDVREYLRALATPEAAAFSKVLDVEWRGLPQPSLTHPDLDALIEIESAISDLRAFREDEAAPAVLAGQADLFIGRLTQVGGYLMNLDHQVVYVGEIGVGKTTAACRQSGLVLDPATAQDLKGMILDTGGGRTTICDVEVRQGDNFSLTVDPVPDEEIYRLVHETAQGLQERADGEGAPTPNDFKPAEEVERALRNMAGLPRPPRARRGAEPAPDPAKALFDQLGGVEPFSAEFAARLSLWRRNRRFIEFDGADLQAGRQWLKSTFTQINNGRHPEFSLPARILATVPFDMFSDDRLDISVIDTRGVDGSAIRPDILAHLRNDRALTLLCSPWGSAPAPTSQDLLRHMLDTDADRTLTARVAVLTLARAGDALSMRHDSGEAASDVEEGYDIKLDQVDDALRKIGVTGVDAIVYDAGHDDPSTLTTFILGKLRDIRSTQAASARSTIAAAREMLANVEQAQALAALQSVSSELLRFARRHETLSPPAQSAQGKLLDAVRNQNARTVWAATRRSGRFWNFDMLQYLGDGAATEAKRRSRKVLGDLRAVLASQADNPDLASARSFVHEVLANADQWEQEFVDAARHHAVAVFLEPFTSDRDLWRRCEGRYGTGQKDYRGFVADCLQAWFVDHHDAQIEAERRIGRAWEATVLAPLLETTGASDAPPSRPDV